GRSQTRQQKRFGSRGRDRGPSRPGRRLEPDDRVVAGQVVEEAPSEAAAARDEASLPSATAAFAPIIVPLVLIFANTLTTALSAEGWWVGYVKLLGSPVVAVAIG